MGKFSTGFQQTFMPSFQKSFDRSQESAEEFKKERMKQKLADEKGKQAQDEVKGYLGRIGAAVASNQTVAIGGQEIPVRDIAAQAAEKEAFRTGNAIDGLKAASLVFDTLTKESPQEKREADLKTDLLKEGIVATENQTQQISQTPQIGTQPQIVQTREQQIAESVRLQKEQKRQQELLDKFSTPTESQKNIESSINTANTLLDSMETLLNDIPAGFGGRVEGYKQGFGAAPKLTEYDTMKTLVAQAVGKAFEGRMTDEDFQRFLGLFPKPNNPDKLESEADRKAMFRAVRAFIDTKKNEVQQMKQSIGQGTQTQTNLDIYQGQFNEENDKKVNDFLDSLGAP
jgi:hypothetical protein